MRPAETAGDIESGGSGGRSGGGRAPGLAASHTAATHYQSSMADRYPHFGKAKGSSCRNQKDDTDDDAMYRFIPDAEFDHCDEGEGGDEKDDEGEEGVADGSDAVTGAAAGSDSCTVGVVHMLSTTSTVRTAALNSRREPGAGRPMPPPSCKPNNTQGSHSTDPACAEPLQNHTYSIHNVTVAEPYPYIPPQETVSEKYLRHRNRRSVSPVTATTHPTVDPGRSVTLGGLGGTSQPHPSSAVHSSSTVAPEPASFALSTDFHDIYFLNRPYLFYKYVLFV